MPGTPSQARRRAAAITVAAVVAIAAGLVVRRIRAPEAGRRDPAPRKAMYVGRQACASCHPAQLAEWTGSDHDLAMQPATPETLLGDFDGARFEGDGVRATFLRRGRESFVRIDGPDGRERDWPVARVIGVHPLQQLVVTTERGRDQALPIAWDTRPAAAGGERWFHLHPGEEITRDHPFHWTALSQNWNFMCAACHATNLQRGYRPDTDTYRTTWSEMDVSCEACHGAGSEHVAWAKSERPRSPSRGLEVVFEPAAPWVIDSGARIAQRASPRRSRAEAEVCARCHARRSEIADVGEVGRPLLDTFRLALLSPGLYFADGQQQDEVYEYGSFLTSRMFAAGVTCSDCHDPHGVRRVAEPDSLCARCHAPAAFAAPEHHHHEAGSPGARCVACHMPARTYMLVDDRRDHGFRVPRPDLASAAGAPDACGGCHAERGARWASDAIAAWRGRERRPHWGDVLQAGRTGNADRRLGALIRDQSAPAIVRATAIELLASPTPTTLERALHDADPIVRAAAASALEALEPRERLRLARAALEDPVRLVRLDAAWEILGAPGEAPLGEPALRARAVRLVRAAEDFQMDRPEGRANLALLDDLLGRHDRALEGFRAAVRLGPHHAPAYIGLADLQRRLGRDPEGEAVLRAGLRRLPDSGQLHYALGLTLIRRGRRAEGFDALRRAAALDPFDPRIARAAALAGAAE